MRVDADDAAFGVHDRTARRAGKQRRGVLDASGDTPSARATEAALRARDETERHPQSPAPGVGDGEDRRTDRDVGRVGPSERRRLRGVYFEYGDVTLGIDAKRLAGCRSSVGERDRHLVAPQVVRVGEDATGRHDNAGPLRPTPGHAHHAVARSAGYRPDGVGDLGDRCHRLLLC
jgi:hypothetical protein